MARGGGGEGPDASQGRRAAMVYNAYLRSLICKLIFRIATNRSYLGVEAEDLVALDSMFRGGSASGKPRDAAVFGFYRRGRYNAIGLRSALTDKWLGQDFWGSIGAKSYSFDSKCEWEVDQETRMSSSSDGTRLLCSSAGWGKGGFVRWYKPKGKEGGGKLSVAEGGEGRRPTIFFIDSVDFIPIGRCEEEVKKN